MKRFFPVLNWHNFCYLWHEKCKTDVPRAVFRRTIRQESIEMAEDLNQQEPTAEEKAKFEQDVLKAAEDAMKLDERRETRDERLF